MNRVPLTAALMGLTLLLTACPQTTTPTPDPSGCAASNASAPLKLAASASLNAGNALSVVYQTPFDGSWDLSDLPNWISASPVSGCGNVKTTLTINRSAAAPPAADQPKLSAALTLSWTANAQRAEASGDTVLSVSADLYVLSGQVSGAVAAAPPVLPAAALRVNGAAVSSGVIVKYKTAAAFSAAVSALPTSGLQVQALSAAPGRTVTFKAQNVSAALSTLRADPNVEYAVPDAVLRAQVADLQAPYVPTDQYAPLQYAYRLMGYGAVWRDMKNSPYPNQVTVAVLDTGVRFDHPDLVGRLWKSGEGALDLVTTDAYGPDTDPTDPGEAGGDGSHGTHVTGIIVAGEGNFAAPCSGCSPSGVVGAALNAPIKVLPVRVIDRFGNASESDVAQGIRYAAGETITVKAVSYTNAHPAKVINLSLGGPISADNAQPLCDAVKAASDRGALVVVAAGNGGAGQPYYPAACPGAVSVGSVRPNAAGSACSCRVQPALRPGGARSLRRQRSQQPQLLLQFAAQRQTGAGLGVLDVMGLPEKPAQLSVRVRYLAVLAAGQRSGGLAAQQRRGEHGGPGPAENADHRHRSRYGRARRLQRLRRDQCGGGARRTGSEQHLYAEYSG